MHFGQEQLHALPHRYRTTLINSVAGFKSANLIGTVAKDGKTNLSIFNSVFHLGAHPPLLGMIVRPHSVPRGTLENILDTGAYTINHVHRDIFTASHQTSARYADEVSEFTATGLSEEWKDQFPAPFVAESRIKLGMDYREHQTLAINQTVLVIGEISAIHVPDSSLGEDGFVDLEAAGSVAVIGLDSYHRTTRLDRLSYAKPDTKPIGVGH